MHIFIGMFLSSNWIILGWTMFLRAAAGVLAQPGTPVPRCQDWSLCLKEAFLAAQKELLDFAAREGRHADLGMTYASCHCKEWRWKHPYTNSYIRNFLNLMVLYWQQMDHLLELCRLQFGSLGCRWVRADFWGGANGSCQLRGRMRRGMFVGKQHLQPTIKIIWKYCYCIIFRNEVDVLILRCCRWGYGRLCIMLSDVFIGGVIEHSPEERNGIHMWENMDL